MAVHRRGPTRRQAVVASAVGVVVVLAAVWYLWPSGSPSRPTAADSAATASASASAGTTSAGTTTPSGTPTPSPTVTRTTAPPPRTGKPGPGNTGVVPGTKLSVVNGDQVYSTANQVVSGLDIRGTVQIRAKNVTIRNSIIRGSANPKCNSAVVWVNNGASATIEDTEIAPSKPDPCLDGIWATNVTMVRLNIHGVVDGLKAFDNTTLRDSYIHDLSWFASDPNQGGGPTHNDAVQTYQGNQHITLRHNTMSPGPKGNAAYQVTQDAGKTATDVHIDGNWLDGGGCTLNFAHKGGPTPMTGIYVTNNRFGRNSAYNCPILLSTQTVLSQLSGNVWDDTGKPIPAPQQHD